MEEKFISIYPFLLLKLFTLPHLVFLLFTCYLPVKCWCHSIHSLGDLAHLICHRPHDPDGSHVDIPSPDLLQVRNLRMLIYFSRRVNLALGTIIRRRFVLFWKSSTVNLGRSLSSKRPRGGFLKAWLSLQPSWPYLLTCDPS